jgi:decaprenyl-phosphate phosphoribosyltransferase
MDNKKKSIPILVIIEALRPGQWIKNLSLFAAAILNGQLFDIYIFSKSLLAFVIFCSLSSASYLINDIVDIQKDSLHPVKKNRPIARGDLSKFQAFSIAFLLILFGLSMSIFININFIVIAILFVFLQIFYSFFLKKKAVVDIIGISLSFIIRVYAGELASGFHLPVWILLTVIFLSLFIASGKRRSELVNTGKKTRTSLEGYGKSLLNFYTTMFGVGTLISYALYTFFTEKINFDGRIHNFLLEHYPTALDKKWYMLTLLPVIFGIMRYGQIIFEMQEGERPERVVASDIPLIISILSWGLMMILVVYVF